MIVDIAFNVTSEQYHSQVDNIMEECKTRSVLPLLVGLDLDSSIAAAEFARKHRTFSYFGIHPLHIYSSSSSRSYQSLPSCSSIKDKNDIMRSSWYDSLEAGIADYKDVVIAVGECGLDYFRSSERDVQKLVFEKQLEIAKRHSLPCFIHCRNAFRDVYERIRGISGVVHSFDGTLEEAMLFIEQGLYIGINGCSMKSQESIEVVREIPLDRIVVETDSPYCLIRRSYAAANYVSLIKARTNMPYFVSNILEAVAAIKGMKADELERVLLHNTVTLFPQINGKT